MCQDKASMQLKLVRLVLWSKHCVSFSMFNALPRSFKSCLKFHIMNIISVTCHTPGRYSLSLLPPQKRADELLGLCPGADNPLHRDSEGCPDLLLKPEPADPPVDSVPAPPAPAAGNTDPTEDKNDQMERLRSIIKAHCLI